MEKKKIEFGDKVARYFQEDDQRVLHYGVVTGKTGVKWDVHFLDDWSFVYNDEEVRKMIKLYVQNPPREKYIEDKLDELFGEDQIRRAAETLIGIHRSSPFGLHLCFV